VKAIVCCDLNWGIGRNNDLLFKIPEDMKNFRQRTLNKVVVMGRNTLLSLPGGLPLKDRTNLVLSSTMVRDGIEIFPSVDLLLDRLKAFNTADVFIIGGDSVYKLMLDRCGEALVTKVKAKADADAFFPNLDQLPNWRLKNSTNFESSSGYELTFCEYENLAVLNAKAVPTITQ
jgi:dihydrofolate reductase